MRKVERGFVVAVPASNMMQPSLFIKQVALTGTEIIGRVFKMMGETMVLTLRNSHSNVGVLTSTKHKMFHIGDNAVRFVTDEELKYWEHTSKAYTFTSNIPYKSQINFVTRQMALRAVIRRLTLKELGLTYTNLTESAKSVKIRAISEVIALINMEIYKLEEDFYKSFKTLENRGSLLSCVPKEVFKYKEVFSQITKDLDGIWTIATHLQRMWLYSSMCCKLKLHL